MIFNSLTFLVFLAITTLAYWMLPRVARICLLFATSIIFYGFWRFDFALLMLLSSTTDYFVSLAIPNARSVSRRRCLLFLSLFVNLSLLFVFKYFQFATDNLVGIASVWGFEIPRLMVDIVLPLGISFYTFQTISYTIDVYRGFVQPERNFILYSVYVTFFPQLVAGPILRASEMLPQLSTRPGFKWQYLSSGIRRILFGLFLKVVLADNIAPSVNSGFAIPASELTAWDVWTLSFLFGFQIYFDFSAYSHIALGSAKLMGIEFPENFNFPYSADSPREFWKRWHISLSSWIRDYLYLPLAGVVVRNSSKGGLGGADADAKDRPRWALSLFLTWSIMGFWHGAAWKFFFWGVSHAFLVQGYRVLEPLRKRVPARICSPLGWMVTLPLIMASWIPFRAKDMEQALIMLGKLVSPGAYFSLGLRENTYLVAAITFLSVFLAYGFQKFLLPYRGRHPALFALPEAILCSVAFALVFIFLRPIEQFIYFQF